MAFAAVKIDGDVVTLNAEKGKKNHEDPRNLPCESDASSNSLIASLLGISPFRLHLRWGHQSCGGLISDQLKADRSPR